MQDLSSKELYMMNGGQKLYIYKDGFGDIYKATPSEEEQWATEVIAIALLKIDTATNRTELQFAIADLVYHHYGNIEELLLKYINDVNPVRQIVFASILWNMIGYEKSFDIIKKNLLQKRSECVSDVFLGLNDFKTHVAARQFLINCLEGGDDELTTRAQYTIVGWAWSGMPILKENNLLEQLKFENRNLPTFKTAIRKLKQILNVVT